LSRSKAQPFADREELVDFVDSRSAMGESLVSNSDEQDVVDAGFVSLETALGSFVLLNRSKPKLMQAKTFLTKLLSLLGAANALLAKSECDAARSVLEKTCQILDQLKSQRNAVETELEALEENTVRAVEAVVKKTLGDALSNVAEGKMDTDHNLPVWRGFLNSLDYAQEVRVTLLESLDRAVERVEHQARAQTSEAVKKVTEAGERVLAAAPAGASGSRQPRVFVPAAMFSCRGRGTGATGVVIGLSRTPELNVSSGSDVFDFEPLARDVHCHAVHVIGKDDRGQDDCSVVGVSWTRRGDDGQDQDLWAAQRDASRRPARQQDRPCLGCTRPDARRRRRCRVACDRSSSRSGLKPRGRSLLDLERRLPVCV
jgi:hypothetical protein